MKAIDVGQKVLVRQGSSVLRGTSTTPEKLTAPDAGAITASPLTRLEGMVLIPAGAGGVSGTNYPATVRLVVVQGTVQGQSGPLTLLPTAEIVAYQ